jgi:hypothetical protein
LLCKCECGVVPGNHQGDPDRRSMHSISTTAGSYRCDAAESTRSNDGGKETRRPCERRMHLSAFIFCKKSPWDDVLEDFEEEVLRKAALSADSVFARLATCKISAPHYQRHLCGCALAASFMSSAALIESRCWSGAMRSKPRRVEGKTKTLSRTRVCPRAVGGGCVGDAGPVLARPRPLDLGVWAEGNGPGCSPPRSRSSFTYLIIFCACSVRHL